MAAMGERSAETRFALLREVFELARAQERALEDGALEDFESMLDRRDTLIAQLQALTPALVDLDELPDNVIPFPGAVSGDVEDALALDTVIRGIIEHDRRNEALLAARLAALREELPGLAAGERLASGYRVPDDEPRFIDQRS
jgi:hypothetical protein